VFSQLTLMRFTSALLGALGVLFAFLLVRELAPARPWLAVLAALLVTYEPMYGFISGLVNNDVGVNAGAAALEVAMAVSGRTVPVTADFSVAFLAVSVFTLAAAPIALLMPRNAGDDLAGRRGAPAS